MAEHSAICAKNPSFLTKKFLQRLSKSERNNAKNTVFDFNKHGGAVTTGRNRCSVPHASQWRFLLQRIVWISKQMFSFTLCLFVGRWMWASTLRDFESSGFRNISSHDSGENAEKVLISPPEVRFLRSEFLFLNKSLRAKRRFSRNCEKRRSTLLRSAIRSEIAS